MQTVIVEKINMILFVLNLVARYVKCEHVKACLARRYIPTAWGLVKITFISAPAKVKGYHPVGFLSFFFSFCVWNNSGGTEIRHQSIHKSFTTGINML